MLNLTSVNDNPSPWAQSDHQPIAIPLFPAVPRQDIKLREIAYVNAAGEPVRARSADRLIINHDQDDCVLGKVSNGFSLIQHGDIIEPVQDGLVASLDDDALGTMQVKDSTANYGGYFRRDYIFPDQTITDSYNCKHHMRVTVSNGMDGGHKATISAASLNPVCDNGLIMSGDKMILSRRHTRNAKYDVLRITPGTIEALVEDFEAQETIIRFWQNKTLSMDEANNLLKSLPGIKERQADQEQRRRTKNLHEKMMAQYEREASRYDATYWAMVSALTFYSSHSEGDFKLADTGHDTAALSLDKREKQVLVWLNRPAFQMAA